MLRPIALQLYSVREDMAQDLAGTLSRIAGMGYIGVETASFPEGVSPRQAKGMLDELGLSICGSHLPLPLGDDKNRVLDTMADLGSRHLICAWLPPEEYQSEARIRRLCERVNEAAAVAAENGITLGMHNHWFEFEMVAGIRPYELWLQYLDPAIFVELDPYWVQVAGVAPLTALADLGARVTHIHVKDGPADGRESPMTAVGQGVIDYDAIIPAATAAEWLIVELDRCATDMLTAVHESYTFLTSKGLAHGKR